MAQSPKVRLIQGLYIPQTMETVSSTFTHAVTIITLQGTNISHLRKIIFKTILGGDMLVPWRVTIFTVGQLWHQKSLSFAAQDRMLRSTGQAMVLLTAGGARVWMVPNPQVVLDSRI